MNSTKILPPHIPYTLPCSFGAIDHGKIYVGQFGTDPTVVANRIPIYIMDINGKMTRVEQPIITNSAGQSMYNDVPTNFYCFDRYSIMVQNAYGDKLFFEMIPGGEFGIPARFDFRTGGTVTTHDMVVFHPAAPGNNHYYFWEGALPKTVPANSAPTPLGPGQWVDVALRLTQDGFDDDYDDLLRFELGANSGATLVGTSTGENVEERITNLTPEDIGAQPVDATLTAIAGVPTAADKIIYFDGVDTAKPTTLTGFGRSLIDDANAAAARTTLGAQAADATLTAMAGVVTAADKIIYFDGVDTAKSTTLTGFGRSLIDDADANTARGTLGAQAADATLTAMAGVTTAADKIIYFDGVDTAKSTTLTGFGRSLIDDAGASEARTTLGAQAADATLTAMAGVVTAADKIIYFDGVDTAKSTTLTGFGRSLIDDADATAGRVTLDAAATVHTHAVGDITGLQGALDGKLSLTGGTLTGDLVVDNSNIKLINDMGSVLSISASRDDFETWAIETSPSDGYGLMISAADDSTHIAMSTVLGAELNDIVVKGRLKNTGQFTELEDPNAYATLDAMDRYITQHTLRISGGNLTGGLGIYTANPYLIMDSTVADGSTNAIYGTANTSAEFLWSIGKLDPATNAFNLNNDATGTKLVLDNGFVTVVGGDIRQVEPQGTEPSSLTRRDFVESNFVNKAGDVMTGGLQALNFQARDIAQGFQGIRISGDANYSEVIPVDSAGSVLWTESLRYLPDTGKWTAQTQGTEPTSLTTKQYVDDAIAAGGGGSGGITFTELGDAVDLNTITTPGYYMQSSDAQATSGTNYPEDAPGILIVYPMPENEDTAPGVIRPLQFYYTSNSYNQYTRYQNTAGNWVVWNEIYNEGNKPSLTDVGATGFGLGTATAYRISNCDNGASQPAHGGWFRTGTDCTNSPYEVGDPKLTDAFLFTLSAASWSKTQLFFSGMKTNEMWIRSVTQAEGNSWTPWVKVFPAAGGGGSTTLGGLTDVADTVSSATEGQVLAYNATSLQWEAKTPAAGGGVTYIELADNVNLDTITTPGFYQQSSKAAVTTALKYPVTGNTGVLIVYAGSDDIDTGGVTQVTQVYIAWGSPSQHIRYNGGSSWSSWGDYFTQFTKPNVIDVGASNYGLGATSPAVVTDCNSTLSYGFAGGWQKLAATTTNAPYPANDPKLNLSVLFTMSPDSTHRAQWYYTTDGSNEIWYRSQYYDGSTRIFMPWTKIFPTAVTLEDVDILRAENQSLRDRVDALEQLVNQILGVG